MYFIIWVEGQSLTLAKSENGYRNRNMGGIDREFTYFQEIIPAKKKFRKGGE